MIPKDLEPQILRLYHAEKWRIGTIASELGIHPSAVRRVLGQDGMRERVLPARPRMVDPFMPFINQTLEKYPKLSAQRLYQMVKQRGYPGKISQFRAVIAEIRQLEKYEAFMRLQTLPGEQAQVDWGHFGRLTYGKAQRPLMGFVITLSYSRATFLHFFLSQSLSNFMRGHQLAFDWFGGVPRVCLYDNLKSVVLERTGQAIRFNSKFLDFAGHYRLEPRPVGIARGNEKGRAERAIRYIRSSFFAARRFNDIDDLNAQALQWCQTTSLERCWQQDKTRTVREALEEERKLLLELPQTPAAVDERKEVSIGKTPYARFDLNDYSVPHTLVRKTVVVVASVKTVRILQGNEVVATHTRSYDRGRQVEDPEHLQKLQLFKKEAGAHRRTNILSQAVPSSEKLLQQMASRGLPLAQATKELSKLLETYRAAAVEEATVEALGSGAAHPHAVRHILDRSRKEQGKPPALAIPLPDDPRVKNLVVTPHSLGDYDYYLEKTDDNNNNQ